MESLLQLFFVAAIVISISSSVALRVDVTASWLA